MIQSELPSAYQKVAYLQGNGSQYLDLGISLTNNSIICATLYVSDGYQNMFAFGGRTSATQNNVEFNMNSNYGYSFDYGDYRVNRINAPQIINSWFDVRCNNLLLAIGDSHYQLSDPGQFSTPNTYLFDTYNRWSAGSGWKGRIKRFYVIGTINLIPCVRKSDSKPGMYDTVSKTFFTNAGTGEFIVPST